MEKSNDNEVYIQKIIKDFNNNERMSPFLYRRNTVSYELLTYCNHVIATFLSENYSISLQFVFRSFRHINKNIFLYPVKNKEEELFLEYALSFLKEIYNYLEIKNTVEPITNFDSLKFDIEKNIDKIKKRTDY